jgi:hypothetical protein
MGKFVLLLAENPKDIIRQYPEEQEQQVVAVESERNLRASVSCFGTIPSTLLNFRKKLMFSGNCEAMTMSFAYMTFFASTMNSL